jgi:uncharacterized protein YlaN (UPF0358 family)
MDWEKLTSVTADGDRNKRGSTVTSHMNHIRKLMHMSSDNLMAFHCIIYQEALCYNGFTGVAEVTDNVILTADYSMQ